MTQIKDGRLTGAQYPTTLGQAIELHTAVGLAATHGSAYDEDVSWVDCLDCDEDTRAVLDRLQDEYVWPYAYVGHRYGARAHLATHALVLALVSAPPPPPPAPIEQPRQLSLWGDL